MNDKVDKIIKKLESLMDEYKDASKDLIYMVDSQNDLMEALDTLVDNIDKWNSAGKIELRRNFAKANSYHQKITDIGEILYN